MAESPDILFEEGAYLGNPLKTSAQKNLRLNHEVELTSNIDKHAVVYEKTDKRIQSLEKAVGKTPVSSPQIDNIMKFSPFKNKVHMPSTCSLIHSGVGQHVLPISPASLSITGWNPNQPIQHFMGFPHNAISATQQDELDKSFNSSDDDFDSEDLSISTDKSPSSPDDDEVCDKETPRIVPLLPPASDSINKMNDLCNDQSICNVLNQKSAVHAGMESTSIQPAEISSSTPIHREVEQPAVSIFPVSPANTLGTPEQPSPVFKLLPHSARSATQSLSQTSHSGQKTSKGKQHD
ncbi:hypothetical protein AgCh_020766 [Apium graveolens]